MPRSAAGRGLVRCEVCELVVRRPAVSQRGASRRTRLACPRCGTALVVREPASLQRTAAYVAAAAVMCVPAYTLPILESRTLGSVANDTIASGIVTLWTIGSPVLAIIVGLASIVVPLAKIAGFAWLLWAARSRFGGRPRARATLFRVVDRIGRWSMLDVYVVAVLVALLQVRAVAEVRPGPAVVAFAAVVVLTLLAARSFDPRLVWDAVPGEANA
jgi:paraquat-inducible protein A